MNVNPSIPGPHFPTAGNARPSAAGNGNRAENSQQSESISSSTSGDARFLLNQLNGFSEVRNEVVARAAERLSRGDYLTDDTAEATAGAILDRLA